MSRRKQLRQEALKVSGRIDGYASLVHERVDNLVLRVRALARKPEALALAFVCGIVAERLRVPGIKNVYGLLVDQLKGLKVASSLLGLPIR